jgi:predicted RNA-binding protein YlxR (DUF448 family)
LSVAPDTTETAAAAPAAPAAAPVRRCLVTGEERPKAELVRFVVGPDGTVVPDIDGRLPGRGLWTLAKRDIVAAAVAKRLFSRAAKGAAAADPALADRVETRLAQRCQATLGLARRAGQAVGGFEKVRGWVERGTCGALVIAAGAGGERRRLSHADIPTVDVLTAAELGGVFGREDLTYAAVARGELARRLVGDAARLAGFRLSDERA